MAETGARGEASERGGGVGPRATRRRVRGHRGPVTISLLSTWSEDDPPRQRPADARRERGARCHRGARGLRRAVGHQKAVAEAVLGRRPGVLSVEANPVAQTATVTYDPARTSVAELRGWVRDCGYHCAGQSVPRPRLRPDGRSRHAARAPSRTGRRGPTQPALTPRRRRWHALARGDGPRRASRGMSMDDMVARHAQPVPGRRGAVDPDRCCGRRSAARCSGSPSRRRSACATTCSRCCCRLPVVFYSALDLLRRRLAGAAGPDAGHDGAGRRRGRRRLAVLAWWSR